MLDRRTYDALERAAERGLGSAGARAANAKRFVDDVAQHAFNVARKHGFQLNGADPAEIVAEELARWIVGSNADLYGCVMHYGVPPGMVLPIEAPEPGHV